MKTDSTFAQFGNNFQTKLIQSLILDSKFFERIYDILELDFFDSKPHNYIYEKIQNYFAEYKFPPTIDNLEIIILSEKDEILRGQLYEIIRTIKKSSVSDTNFIKDESIKFCRNQKMRTALYKSIDLWETGKYDDIYKLVGDALKAGEETNIGHDYWQEAALEHRILLMKRMPVSTGLKHLDIVLNGGLSRGELASICGSTGLGKCVDKNTKIEIEYDIIEITINAKVYEFNEFDKILTKRGTIFAKDLMETDDILI